MTTATNPPTDPLNSIPDFESLVRTLRPQLVRFLANIVGETEAEDVVQSVFTKAAVALPTFRGEASPRTWLFSIAINAARDWLRAHARPEAEAIETVGAEPADPHEDASQERRLVREQMSQCVGELLRRLPQSYQVVLALSDCEELADQEIASILGMTLGATKIRLHRARTKLREEIERGCSLYRDEQNVLCCDRKESAQAAYRLDESTRLQEETNKTAGSRNDLNEVCTMTAVEILPGKQKSLIGVGASIVAGCQPCTLSFAAAARQAGACDRGVRFAIESGLAGRQRATASMSAFANEKLAAPELDAAFRAEKASLDALICVAAAIASNAATLVKSCVDEARARGATDDQIRATAEVARIAQRGAERETDTALELALGGAHKQPCSTKSPTESGSTCGCGSNDKMTSEFETVRIEKTTNACSLCEDYAEQQAHKPIVVMSCEGACLRGEIARQAANHLCHTLAPEKTARLCLGGAFTKDTGQRALVREAKKIVALEGCSIRCASRMMRGHFPELAAEVIVTDGLCKFDRNLFGAEELPTEAVQALGRTVATTVAARL